MSPFYQFIFFISIWKSLLRNVVVTVQIVSIVVIVVVVKAVFVIKGCQLVVIVIVIVVVVFIVSRSASGCANYERRVFLFHQTSHIWRHHIFTAQIHIFLSLSLFYLFLSVFLGPYFVSFFFKYFFWCAPFGYLYFLFHWICNVIASIAYIHPVYGGIRTHDLLDVNLPL